MREKKYDINECLLGIVLDATLSFVEVYPQVYYFLERLMICLEQMQQEDNYISCKYALTVFRDEPEVKTFFGNIVTDDREDVLDALSELTFSGGSVSGAENITEAVRCMLELPETQKGLLVISDALAKEERGFVDLTQSAGIRFAYVYSGDETYLPQFHLVDKNGRLTSNDKNICIYAHLSDLLKNTEEEEVHLAEEIAEEMIQRFL